MRSAAPFVTPLDLADRRRCNDGVTRPSLGASSCGLHWAYPPGSPPSWLATDPSATSLPSPLRAFSWSLALSAPASPWPLSASFSTRSNAHSQTQANPFRRVPLEEHVEGRTAGLVQPRHQPTLIVLDGLDEKGVTEGNDLLSQVQYYVDAYPKSRVLVTCITLPGLRLPERRTPVSPLSEDDSARLISRIAGRTVALPELYSWSDSVRAAARRPLFAVMIGVELRQAATLGLHRPVELLDRLARQVVESAPDGGAKLDSLLQNLAARAISTGTRVRKTDVAPNHADERQLANSRLGSTQK